MHATPPRVDAIRDAAAQLAGTVTAVCAYKGGVGKTSLAIELAYTFGAVLVDLDHDYGGASRQLGHRAENYVRAGLLDALDSGRTPRPKSGHSRPDLVPSSPDMEPNLPEAATTAAALRQWAVDWKRPVVADTHPGAGPGAAAAMMAARVIVVPVLMERAPLDGVEQMCAELPDYPLLLVPYRVPSVPPASMLDRLRQIARAFQVPVGPVVTAHNWHGTRLSRTAVTALPRPSVRAERMAEQVCHVAEAVIGYER